jgi:hypothetical protein
MAEIRVPGQAARADRDTFVKLGGCPDTRQFIEAELSRLEQWFQGER